ncbi:MAG: NAD(P)-binding protein [Linnemannia elongata]|nr:MAG: NAD(P)-binding protein [Linnemannia elongata]
MASPGFFARTKLVNPAQSVSKDQDALRIGILGAATIAPNALIGPAKHSRSIVVVSIAARDQVKAKEYAEKNGIPNTHPTYEALIADPEIDCIYNPLPNGLHYEWTRKALEAGKHVLLEKPAASNAFLTQQLVDLARAKNLVLLEAFHYRFHPASIKFRELVLEEMKKEKVKVERVEAIMSFPQVFPKDDIRFRYNLGGGVTMDSGCYTVNAIRYFTNLPVYDVQSAHPRIVAEDPDVDGRMEMVLKLGKVGEGGGEGMRERGIVEAKAVASLTNPMWSLQTWREYLPRVVVETEGKVLTFMVFLIPSLYHYITVKDKTTNTSETLKVYGEGYSTYKYQLDAFIKAVQHVRSTRTSGTNARDNHSCEDPEILGIPGWVSGEDSVENMRVVDAIYKAAGMKLRV